MLQVNFLRQNRDLAIQKLSIRNFKDIDLVDQVISADDKRKKLQTTVDELLAKRNSLSKEIGASMAKGLKEEAEEKKKLVADLKTDIEKAEKQLIETGAELQNLLVRIPNLPSDKVPAGKTPEDNVNIKEGGSKPILAPDAVPHWELTTKYSLIDFELGNKITGSGFPVYKNKGAKLQRALIQYFLDYNTAAGYIEYEPPFMVNEDSAYGTGQLPDKEGQMYHAVADNFYLIPTAEVPLTNIYRDEIVNESLLPIKMTAYTPCFRREAGSYGKDVRGLNRLHQFDKVEIVELVHPDKSYEVLETMVQHIEKLLQSLELPYRILKLCGGDMGFTSALTYDFEVYSAAQQKWLEVSSVSNFETFQTNRMKIRFRDGQGKIHLVHSLNGSSMALPRIVAALLENNQTAEGIRLPEVLYNYFGTTIIN
ncbi:serine--tRNA ligase [Pollutibacter soli]|uniref:serine--tRNA ligase n=1 Tax=Pollutibacter soli TaxID=3034157 RepID=UPI0030140752